MVTKALRLTFVQEQTLIKIAKYPGRSVYELRIRPATITALRDKGLLRFKMLGNMLQPHTVKQGLELTTEGEFIVNQLLRGKSFHPAKRAETKKGQSQ